MSERIRLSKLRDDVEFVRGFIDGDSSQAGGFLDEFSAVLLPLVEAVEADHALTVAEERGFDLDPAEHRELIARHDNALARFDFSEPDV